jgi:conjugative relaxase-like TrwC/TraI family protein
MHAGKRRDTRASPMLPVRRNRWCSCHFRAARAPIHTRGGRGGVPILRVHTLDSSPKAIRYFDDVARRDGGVEDYFSGRGERPGRWLGTGLEHVGLHPGDEVDIEAVRRVIFHGEHPVTGEPLGQRMRKDGIAGFGMTFSAPKSVSLLWALASPEVAYEVEAAEAAAVQAGLTFVERHASYARRGRNGIEQVDGGGFIASAYFHRTSRECDPQLHTHVLVANRTLCEDSRWRTLDSRQLMWRTEMLKAAGAVYQLALRAELSRSLGVEWEPVDEHGQADIAGVPRSLIEEFSKRSAQVRAAAAEVVAERASHDPARLGRDPSQWELQKAAYDTRRHKVGVDSDRIHELWRAEAAELGWDGERLRRATMERTLRPVRDRGEPEATRSILVDLTLREAAFRAGHAALAVARHVEVDSAAKAVDVVEAATAAVLASAEVIQLAGPEPSRAGFPKRASDGRSTVTRAGDRCYSVDAVLAQEIRVLERAEAGRTAGAAVVPAGVLDRAIAAHDEAFPRRPLSDDQRRAVAAFTADGQRLSILIGPAGTGKSVTLGVARAAWEAAGYRVRGYAPFGAAAASLQQSAGMDSEVVAKLLYEQRRLEQLPPDQRDRWALTSRDVVVVDEAGTLGTADLDQLLAAVDAAGAKLVLAGDHRQLAPVVRGGLFPELHRRLGGAELTEAHRFDIQWEREAAMAIRRQDVAGLDNYAAHDRIRSGDRQAMIEAVYDHWADGYLRGRDSLMVARTNEVVDELNQRAHRLLVERGRVEAGGIAIAGGAVANAGDVIITRHPDRRIRVTGASGHVRNGARWRVVVAGPAVLVAEELGPPPGSVPGRANIPAWYAAEHVRLGYAATGHSSQGRTVDRVGVVVQGGEDANWLYSALTRGREGTMLFVATEATELAAEYGKEPPTARQVLEAVVVRDDEQQSAVAELEAGLARSEGVPHLEVLATAEHPTRSLAQQRRALRSQLLRMPSERDVGVAAADVEHATRAVARAGERSNVARRRLHEVESRPFWRRSGQELRTSRQSVIDSLKDVASAERGLANARENLATRKVDAVAASSVWDRLELIEAALGVQVERAVVRSPGYLVAALGRRPPDGTPARRDWDERATRLENYRHFELGVGPDDGALGASGMEAAVGVRPSDPVGRMTWDHVVEGSLVARGHVLERESLGIDL